MLAKRDVRQHSADLAGGEKGECVQIHLRSIHCVPIAKLRYEVASMGRSIFTRLARLRMGSAADGGNPSITTTSNTSTVVNS